MFCRQRENILPVKTGERKLRLKLDSLIYNSFFHCHRVSLHFDDTFDSMHNSNRKVDDFDNNPEILIMV